MMMVVVIIAGSIRSDFFVDGVGWSCDATRGGAWCESVFEGQAECEEGS